MHCRACDVLLEDMRYPLCPVCYEASMMARREPIPVRPTLEEIEDAYWETVVQGDYPHRWADGLGLMDPHARVARMHQRTWDKMQDQLSLGLPLSMAIEVAFRGPRGQHLDNTEGPTPKAPCTEENPL